MKPATDNFEKDLAGTAKVLRIDFLSMVGHSTIRQYEAKIISTNLVLDPYRGVVFHQTGTFDSDFIKSKVIGLQNPEPQPMNCL